MRWLLLGIDADLAGALDLLLRPQGHELIWCRHSSEGAAIRRQGLATVVLEWPGPESAELAWLHRLRQEHEGSPMMVLTTAAHLTPRARQLTRLDCTFILQPIAIEVLAAQLVDLAQGCAGLGTHQRRCGDVEFDLRRRTAVRQGSHVELTTREWMVIDTLLQSAGRAVSKEELAARVIFDASAPANAVEVHLSNIRRKLGRALIETIRGRGYRIRA